MSAFEQLRQDPNPVAPDRRFADSLRARIVAELAPAIELPERSDPMTDPASTAPAATATITPYLAVHDADRAIAWYVGVFGAREAVRYVGDDGRIGHAELELGGARIYLSDEYPDIGVLGPRSMGGSPVALNVVVPDVDAVWEMAIAAGAEALRPPEDQPYGERSSQFRDPFGHRWMVQSTIATPSHEEIDAAMEGFEVVPGGPTADPPAEIAYVTFSVDDSDRAVRFYGALFGWDARPGNAGPGYFHIGNTRLPLGVTPLGNDVPPTLYVRVSDAAAAAARVADLGGEVVRRSEAESGVIVECRDDQGRTFHIIEPAPGY